MHRNWSISHGTNGCEKIEWDSYEKEKRDTAPKRGVSICFRLPEFVSILLAHLWLINFVGAIFKIYAGIMVLSYMQAAKIKFAAIYKSTPLKVLSVVHIPTTSFWLLPVLSWVHLTLDFKIGMLAPFLLRRFIASVAFFEGLTARKSHEFTITRRHGLIRESVLSSTVLHNLKKLCRTIRNR